MRYLCMFACVSSSRHPVTMENWHLTNIWMDSIHLVQITRVTYTFHLFRMFNFSQFHVINAEDENRPLLAYISVCVILAVIFFLPWNKYCCAYLCYCEYHFLRESFMHFIKYFFIVKMLSLSVTFLKSETSRNSTFDTLLETGKRFMFSTKLKILKYFITFASLFTRNTQMSVFKSAVSDSHSSNMYDVRTFVFVFVCIFMLWDFHTYFCMTVTSDYP